MKILVLFALVAATRAMDIIDGEFILQLKPDIDESVMSSLLKSDFDAEVQKYFHFENLIMAHIKTDEKNIERIRQLPAVTFVEPNQWFHATQTCGVPEACPDVWGLDRIDQSDALPYTDPTGATFDWGESDGTGATAYVVDTGIRITHQEFGGRATWGHSAGSNPEEDDNGHGTHCAGTIGSRAYGVAKNVNLVAVKVLNSFGSGSTADVIEGIDWVTLNHAERASINLSLGGGPSPSLDTACDRAIDSGVAVVCAAGNSDADACNSSPGSTPRAITVGATEIDDQSASYTNYGSCVDIFAPGTDIKSTWHLSDTSTNTISGTSMACPHVVGAAARFQGAQATEPAPIDVTNYIVSNGTPNKINFRVGHEAGSVNLLLYSPCTLPQMP